MSENDVIGYGLHQLTVSTYTEVNCTATFLILHVDTVEQSVTVACHSCLSGECRRQCGVAVVLKPYLKSFIYHVLIKYQ